MARRPPAPTPQPAVLSVDQMRRGIARLNKRIEDVETFEPQSVGGRNAPEVSALSTSIEETLGSVFGAGTIQFNRYRRAADVDPTARLGIVVGGSRPYPLSQVHEDLERGKQSSLAHLRQAVRFLEEEIAEHGQAPAPAAPAELRKPSRKVFVVHGHDEGSREGVARFLAQAGFEPVILHERPNKGRTIITKFREEAADIGFAVVLMTPDDTGGKAGSGVRPRARQNVVFELGFFIGALGPERVVALVKGDVERPSDFEGVVYIDLDSAGAWRTKLGQELEAAGLEVDWNKVMRG
jgi:predicted nucleotide-binding protein